MRLEEEGYLIYIDKERMEEDKLFPKNRCFSAFLKQDMRDLDKKFFKLAKDEECNEDLYETNLNKDIDKVLKQVAAAYVHDLTRLSYSLPSNISDSK